VVVVKLSTQLKWNWIKTVSKLCCFSQNSHETFVF